MVAKLRTHNRFSFSVRRSAPRRRAFGLPHEARGTFDAEERDLLLTVGQVVRPVVVTQPQPTGHAFADAPEAFADALADRLQGLEAGPALGGMKTDALGRAVVNGHEDKGWPRGDGHRGRHVRTPHYVGRLSGDGPVVRLRPVRVTRALRGLEVVLPHQPPHPLLRVRRPSTRNFAHTSPAMKRQASSTRRTWATRTSSGRRRPDRGETRRRGRGRLTRAYTLERAQCHTRQTRCMPYARRVEIDWAHSSRRPPPGQRAAGLQLVHLRMNSVSISSSPILACSRRWSSSRASVARLFRPACPAARN